MAALAETVPLHRHEGSALSIRNAAELCMLPRQTGLMCTTVLD
jgi:hypothetical protein